MHKLTKCRVIQLDCRVILDVTSITLLKSDLSMKIQINRKISVLTFVTVVGLGMHGQALAYLDPATGSIILQGIIAACAGVAVTAKLYWSRIKAFFGHNRDHEDNETLENVNDKDNQENPH